jgi:hypothetical protein
VEELTREQALDELDVLATVEHALVVEYLSVSYALMPPPNATAPAPAASAAAGAARGLAEREMRHLHQVNGALTRAGRAVQVGRASSIGRGTGEIALGPPTAVQLEHLREREHAIASAVDARYARICDALAAEDPLFFCPDHVEPLADLQSHLGRREPSEFLHTRAVSPTTSSNGRSSRSATGTTR